MQKPQFKAGRLPEAIGVCKLFDADELLPRAWEAMGLEASSLKGLESNEYLGRFCGEVTLSPLDPIWNKLFSHSVKPVLVRLV